jgi:acyl-CoA thioester hydrolase
MLKKILESSTKIRFHDCDPFGHLNNSRYIDYFLTARGDQLIDDYSLDIYDLAKNKAITWVTAQTQVSYLVPALVMEEVVIQTQLNAYTEKSLLFEGQMWNAGKTVLKAIMWAKLVHFNLKTGGSYSHSPELMTLFEQVVNPVSGETNFESRVKELKNNK